MVHADFSFHNNSDGQANDAFPGTAAFPGTDAATDATTDADSPTGKKSLRERMLQDLKLRGMAERTQKGYLREVRKLAAYYNTSPDLLTEQQVADYLLHLINDCEYAPGSLRVAYSGLKFFYTHTEPRDWDVLKKLRIPKQQTLPDVLSIDEVHRLIGAVRQPRNRVYFWTVYTLGLRMSEALNLEVGDIDSARGLIHVHRGKGAKDRFVPLPESTLLLLRDYWRMHRNPRLLFPQVGRSRNAAATATRPMDPTTVQGCMTSVVRELKFAKKVTLHTLRHSVATHLFEGGVSLRWIQKFLGRGAMPSLAWACRHPSDLGNTSDEMKAMPAMPT